MKLSVRPAEFVRIGVVVAGLAAASGASAGGFGIREQSAYFLGSAFAGDAAGGPSISSMFWNASTMTQSPKGLTTESSYSGIFGDTKIAPTAATSALGGSLLALGDSGNIFNDALVPASYVVYHWTDQLAVGLALNAPFGLITSPKFVWAGEFYSRTSKVFSFNATPQLAYQVNNWLSVGVGLQVEYFKVRLDGGFPGSNPASPADPASIVVRGQSTDVGFTAGATLTPWPTTTIGVGYRSQITHSLQGDVQRPAFVQPVPGIGLVAFPAALVGVSADITVPDEVTASIRHRLTDSWTLLGTAEWTNWSTLGTVTLVPVVPGVPGVPTALSFQWRDGWFLSGGAEYQWSANLALRGGVAWEESPVTDVNRGTRLPDNDRIWLTAGLSYKWNDKLSFDLAYAHIFVKDAPISIVPGNPAFSAALGTFIGTASSSIDIFSVGFRYRWGASPLVPLITKG